MKPSRIQNYLQSHSVIAVPKTAKNQSHQKKPDIFGDQRIISASCEFFYNLRNLRSLMQAQFIATRIETRKLFLPLTFLKSGESIKSGILFPSIFSSNFLNLSFITVGSGTLSISLSSKGSLSKLVNG